MSALATELKMASGYPDGNYLTLTVRDFIADAAKRSGGSLKIELHNNQTLVKLPEMMRAAQTNQVAIADVRLGNYGNQDPVYIVDAIPFVAGDYDSALKLWQASKPYLVDSFAKRGLKVQESQFFTRNEPIPGLGASPEVSEQAFTLDTGKVSGPLRTGTGVAFLTVTGSEAARVPALTEIKDRVTADLKRKKAQDLARTRAQAMATTLKASSDFAAAAKAAGLTLRTAENLARNPVLITALNDRIGYERGAAIVKQAYREGRAVIDVAREVTGLSQPELQDALDPLRLTRPSTPAPKEKPR